MTFNVWLVPLLAENDRPVQGRPRRTGASRQATVPVAVWARVVVRPVR
ncbi:MULTISPECIES: hypothetical protein [unclassified Streptomyces]|nr:MULTISPECIES: hypothetical protein [unclassified Streptomyces]MDF3143040.1 hypothetical protein [Streptomyces sp. T21Q-yed]WDF44450.1 hypothetical protein PBV52_50565 [Streptomyces sp. T12]